MTTPVSSAVLSTLDPPKPTKAKDAAQQFEALLIGQILRSIHEEEDDEDSAGAPMLDVASQQFSQLLARNGGMGLARMIVKGLGENEQG
jgi:Rod binding domain-containing protein